MRMKSISKKNSEQTSIMWQRKWRRLSLRRSVHPIRSVYHFCEHWPTVAKWWYLKTTKWKNARKSFLEFWEAINKCESNVNYKALLEWNWNGSDKINDDEIFWSASFMYHCCIHYFLNISVQIFSIKKKSEAHSRWNITQFNNFIPVRKRDFLLFKVNWKQARHNGLQIQVRFNHVDAVGREK